MPTELTVADVMEPAVAAVAPGDTVQHALTAMHSRRVGSVLVLDGSALVGIFTERDLLRHVTTVTPPWRDLPVGDWMTARPHTITPDVPWDEAADRMARLRVRHLPVLDAGRVVGVLSTRMLMAKRDEVLSRKVAERTRDLRAANDQLMARDAETRMNLRAAGKLQTKLMLPGAPPAWPELTWALRFQPLDHLGGDYYDFAEPAPGKLGFLIADASGHSLPAAMVAIMARFAFAESSRTATDPGAVLARMNAALVDVSEEHFVTAFYGVFDRDRRVLRYAAAGHPDPLHYRARTGMVEELVARGFLLGVIPDESYSTKEVALEPGDRLLFYTDGLTEARNEIGELFGAERLTRLTAGHGRSSLATYMDALDGSLGAFRGTAARTDDLTVAVAEVVG